MTLCAAGINKQSGINIIFAVSDMKLSFWSGAFSADGIAHKIKGLNDRWMVMIGGDVSAMVPLLDAVADAAQKDRKNTVRSFARRCSQAYREERKKIIETEILSQYDLSSYQEYLDLKPTGVTLFDAITKK